MNIFQQNLTFFLAIFNFILYLIFLRDNGGISFLILNASLIFLFIFELKKIKWLKWLFLAGFIFIIFEFLFLIKMGKVFENNFLYDYNPLNIFIFILYIIITIILLYISFFKKK